MKADLCRDLEPKSPVGSGSSKTYLPSCDFLILILRSRTSWLVDSEQLRAVRRNSFPNL